MKPETKKENWDHFWKQNARSRFSRVSWSKIRMMKLLDGFVKPGMNVLDAGCGSGFFSQYFLSKGCAVYTLDYSEEALEVAKQTTQNASKAYLKENLLDPAFGDRYQGRFDLIFTDGLFEHFSAEDQRIIIKNFDLAKKTDGIVTTFVPNLFSWWEIVRPLVMPGIHEKPFTAASLLALHQGMEIVARGGLNVLPIAPSPERLLGSHLGMLLYCFAR